MTDPLADLAEQLDESEQERLVDHLQGIAEGSPQASRRDLLQAGGAVGVGALFGGSGVYAATGAASADPSTSDGDGNVGTPSDPVDVFAEGLGGPSNDGVDVGDNLDLQGSQEIQNAAAINTEDLIPKLLYGTTIYPHPDFGPLNDAVDYAIDNGERAVRCVGANLNPATVDRSGNVMLTGTSRGRSQFTGASTLLTLKKDKTTVQNFSFSADDQSTDCVHITSSTANRPFEVHVFENYFQQGDRGVWIDGREAIVRHNHFNSSSFGSNEVVLTSNADKCVVSDNTQISAVTNNGSKNVVTDNSSP